MKKLLTIILFVSLAGCSEKPIRYLDEPQMHKMPIEEEVTLYEGSETFRYEL